jgi:hypothetical protein
MLAACFGNFAKELLFSIFIKIFLYILHLVKMINWMANVNLFLFFEKNYREKKISLNTTQSDTVKLLPSVRETIFNLLAFVNLIRLLHWSPVTLMRTRNCFRHNNWLLLFGTARKHRNIKNNIIISYFTLSISSFHEIFDFMTGGLLLLFSFPLFWLQLAYN